MSEWSVYLLRCGDGSLYTGIATDVARRIGEHASGSKGAKYLRGRGPLQLQLEYKIGSRSLASKIEYRLKNLSKGAKEDMDALPQRIDGMLAEIQAQDSTAEF